MRLKARMLSSTVLPLAVAGVAGALTLGAMTMDSARANPCAVKRASSPCAVRSPCATRRGCGPCAPRSPCSPCAAASPCAPCAPRDPCAPCDPCAPGAMQFSERCTIPRLQAAAKCLPCAAKRPCAPCAPRRTCNPCVAKPAANPCAAKRPCAPCGPRAACGPCAPCGPAAVIELKPEEATAAYDCILQEMKAAYAKSGIEVAATYTQWKRYSEVAYQSATHGNRFVQNYANPTAKAYGQYEAAGKMPADSYLVKDSFVVTEDGKISVGPLFIMRKMPAGWNAPSEDWKYAMVMPDGSFFGETRGRNSEQLNFCYECHLATGAETDSMLFLPEELRVK